MGYVSSLDSTNATFSSPSMGAQEMGILIQSDSAGDALGVPTWDGSNMTEVLQVELGGASIGIWYIKNPTEGVTTIARGTNAQYCAAIRAQDVAFGTVIGDTTQVGGGGQGGANLLLDGVILVDLLVAANIVDDGTVGVSYLGQGSIKETGSTGGDDNVYVATAEGQSGDNVSMSWNYGTAGDTTAIAVAFHGRSRPVGSSGVVFQI